MIKFLLWTGLIISEVVSIIMIYQVLGTLVSILVFGIVMIADAILIGAFVDNTNDMGGGGVYR